MKKREGFTLIELLVVIAIIGMLLAILAPSLNKVKDKAKEVVCKTHLRGVGLAVKLYLNDYDDKAFDFSRANRHYWYDPSNPSRYIDYTQPNCPEYYWGLVFVDYAEDPSAFGCPSYVRVKDMLYDTGDETLSPYAGYGLNAFFFRDAQMVMRGQTGSAYNWTNRKLSNIKAPFQFVVVQDHPEPRYEGWSSANGNEQNDQLYIPSGASTNLRQYRPPGAGGTGSLTNPNSRSFRYWSIFRHSKRSRALDDPAEHEKRSATIDSNPNGKTNILFLDGHVDGIAETTGINTRESWYSGINQIK